MLRVFISYSHQDESFRQELETHLKIFERLGLVEYWHDRKIIAPDNWESAIDANLATADILILLVSADFLASDYCHYKEMTSALERHTKGTTRVVPVVLRSCQWRHSPLKGLQALPTDGKPVSTWSDRDEAWHDVTSGLLKVIESIQGQEAAHKRILESFAEMFSPSIHVLIGTELTPELEGRISKLHSTHPEIAEGLVKYRRLADEYRTDVEEAIRSHRRVATANAQLVAVSLETFSLAEKKSNLYVAALSVYEKFEQANEPLWQAINNTEYEVERKALGSQILRPTDYGLVIDSTREVMTRRSQASAELLESYKPFLGAPSETSKE